MGTGAYFGCLSFLNPATIHNWAKFYTKDTNGNYIRPYEERDHNTTNETTPPLRAGPPLRGGSPSLTLGPGVRPHPFYSDTPGYDAAGNLTDMPTTDGSPGHEFIYDAAGNLTDLDTTDGSPEYELIYDYRNRLIRGRHVRVSGGCAFFDG